MTEQEAARAQAEHYNRVFDELRAQITGLEAVIGVLLDQIPDKEGALKEIASILNVLSQADAMMGKAPNDSQFTMMGRRLGAIRP